MPDGGVLLVSDIEAELDYDIPAQFEMTTGEAIGWQYRAEWGDGQVTLPDHDNTPTHINDKRYRLRNMGTYAVSFPHAYTLANAEPGYPVVLVDAGQYAGYNWPDGQFNQRYPQLLKVWGRVPVKSVSILTGAVKPGSRVHVEIQLEGTAPPSNTRVDLAFPTGLFAPLLPYVVVPKGATKITPEFTLLNTARVGHYPLSAWTSREQKDKPPKATLIVAS